MTINSNRPPQIHKAQVESLKTEYVKDENLHGMDKELRLVLIELPALGAGTKKVYGTAFTKLIKKVKKLENFVKTKQARRKARIIVSDEEEDLEDPSKQGRKIAEINQDPNISLVQHDAKVQGRHEHDIKPNFEFTTAEPVSIAGASVSTTGTSSAKDNGKAIMEEAETIQTKTKLQLEQERLGYEEALRLQAGIDEEESLTEDLHVSIYQEHGKSYTEAVEELFFDEIKNLFEITMRRVHIFVPMESESERVIPELAAGSSKRDAEEELVQESSKRLKTGESSVLAEEPKDKEEEELKYWKIIRVSNHTEVYQFFDDMLKAFDREDLVKPWSLVKEMFTSTEQTEDKERELWVELKRLFEPDADDELWKSQKHIFNVTWRLYDTCGVHHVSTEDGMDIYMLVEREYPLSRGVLTQMVVAKLLVEQDNEMSRELLRKIFMQLGESMSLAEAEIAKKERRVHETHASLVIGRDQALEVDKEAVERQKKMKMKGIAIDVVAQELLKLKKGTTKSKEDYTLQHIPKGSSEGSGSKPEVPDKPKGKTTGLSKGADEEEVILSSDDERTESEREVEESDKVDDETADDEEEVHEVKEMHDANEIHDNNEETDEEIADAEKVDTEKTKEEKVDNEQARADPTAKDDQAGALISVT
ncbi:hypothetical protein Tco_0158944 [Tanacetum coccineum]